jgi:hypothetical protein
MAIRTKTIEYAFPASEASVAAATARAFTQITVYIPETTNRTFKSCFLIVYVQDNVTTAASPTSWRIQAAVGGAALDTTGDGAALTDTITNTGEQCAWMFTRDVTSLFTADTGAGGWMNATPATSRAFDCTITIATSSTINASCKLVITYDYDDSATTKIKTVKIPIESATGARTTSLVEIGTNQVPLLDNFLPEASKTYRDIFFEIYCNDGTATSGAADFTLGLALDAEAADNTGTIEAGLLSARSMYYIWKRTDMTTNAAHAFKASVSSTAGGTFDCLGAILVVTYEYNESSTSTVINSLQLPAFDAAGFLGGSTSTDLSRATKSFFIEEPASITLVQSGVQVFLIDSAAVTLNIKCGSQTARAYTLPSRTMCGGWGLIHRIDSGGAQGAGITLASGLNTLTMDLYSGSTTSGSIGTASSAILYLNYTSGKSAASGGTCNHNHTVQWFSQKTIADTINREYTAFAPVINETSYYLNSVGYEILSFCTTPTTSVSLGYFCLTLKAEYKSGEGPADGWCEIYSGLFLSDNEEGVHIQVGKALDNFLRYPTDPDTNRMNIETSRKYRLEAVVPMYTSFYMFYTYHTITKTISGTVTGYTGDGSGITVEAHRTDTDEKIGSTTTAAGGTYSITWYDNTINVYTHARQDATHVGRSDDDLGT